MEINFKGMVFATTFSIGVILLTACGSANTSEAVTPESAEETESSASANISPTTDLDTFHPLSLEIVTLLPRDAIPAIDNPSFLTPEEADEEYVPDELVIGVEYNGDARAYSTSFLSRHEIVNDTVGGRKIAVTW